MEGGASPRVAPFADVQDLGALLQRARFALPVVDADTLTVTYADPLALMHELRAMGAANVLRARRRTPLRRATLMRAVALYQERFGLPNGRVPATFEIITLTAWAPHESQQQPLQPGTAKMRLADALAPWSSRLATRPRPFRAAADLTPAFFMASVILLEVLPQLLALPSPSALRPARKPMATRAMISPYSMAVVPRAIAGEPLHEVVETLHPGPLPRYWPRIPRAGPAASPSMARRPAASHSRQAYSRATQVSSCPCLAVTSPSHLRHA